MKPDDDAFDLIALARRGDLSATDERRLRERLASSGEARVLYEAGRAFDREAPVMAGDDERIAKIERAVQARLREPRAASRRRLLLRTCLAAALLASSAVAAGVLTRSSGPNAPPGPTPNATEQGAAPLPVPVRAPAPPPAPAPDPAPAPEPTPAPEAKTATTAPASVAPAPASPRPAASPKVDEPTAQPPGASAQDLFSAASHARVAGDRAEAIRLSRELVTRYPSSDEAAATYLSLGMLYLQDGQPGPALDAFRTSEKVGPQTVAEALWGESQALRQLGRAAEERATLEALLASYPQSAYAGAAKKRLDALP